MKYQVGDWVLFIELGRGQVTEITDACEVELTTKDHGVHRFPSAVFNDRVLVRYTPIAGSTGPVKKAKSYFG